jgi:hypothetical protein
MMNHTQLSSSSGERDYPVSGCVDTKILFMFVILHNGKRQSLSTLAQASTKQEPCETDNNLNLLKEQGRQP